MQVITIFEGMLIYMSRTANKIRNSPISINNELILFNNKHVQEVKVEDAYHEITGEQKERYCGKTIESTRLLIKKEIANEKESIEKEVQVEDIQKKLITTWTSALYEASVDKGQIKQGDYIVTFDLDGIKMDWLLTKSL